MNAWESVAKLVEWRTTDQKVSGCFQSTVIAIVLGQLLTRAGFLRVVKIDCVRYSDSVSEVLSQSVIVL